VAENGNEQSDTGVITRLSKAGEDAINRLAEELGKNDRVTDAVARAMSAKDKMDERTRKTLGQVGVAAADEIKDLRGRLEKLEKRLAALEQKPKTAAKPKTTAAKKPAAKRTASAAKASAAKKTTGGSSEKS
jgi:hypothetical protein